jgi:uncharacterized protein (TIGR00266 family)
MQYYYIDSNGKTAGPLGEDKLRELHANDEIKDDTEIAAVGAAEWTTFASMLSDSLPVSSLKGAPSPPPSLSDSALLPPSPVAGEVASVPASSTGSISCDEIDYEVIGDDLQVVEVELDPGETVIAEAGAMNYMEEGISFEAKMGDGSHPNEGLFGKLLSAGKRVLTGESIFMTHFTNNGSGKRRVAFAAPYPGKILDLNMAELGKEVFCQKDSFLCAAHGTEVSIAFQKRLGAGFFGGEGFILQKLKGDGMAFSHAGGTVVRKELNGQTLRVDTGCIVAFTSGVEYDIQMAGGLKSMFFGGEGLFLATLSGHGTVWLQSLPFSRLADRILQSAPSAGGKSKGEGSVLGGIGRLLDGD